MGRITIDKADHALMAFVLVLSFSRQIFLRFSLNARMGNFLRGHTKAFTAWKGLPRVLLYDDLFFRSRTQRRMDWRQPCIEVDIHDAAAYRDDLAEIR